MSELKPKQKEACEILVCCPEKTVTQIAEEIGVDRRTLQRWFKKPEWKEYEHMLCQEKFNAIEKLAIEKLTQNVANNNQRAIEYALNYIGYKPKEEIDLSTDFEINITE